MRSNHLLYDFMWLLLCVFLPLESRLDCKIIKTVFLFISSLLYPQCLEKYQAYRRSSSNEWTYDFLHPFCQRGWFFSCVLFVILIHQYSLSFYYISILPSSLSLPYPLTTTLNYLTLSSTLIPPSRISFMSMHASSAASNFWSHLSTTHLISSFYSIISFILHISDISAAFYCADYSCFIVIVLSETCVSEWNSLLTLSTLFSFLWLVSDSLTASQISKMPCSILLPFTLKAPHKWSQHILHFNHQLKYTILKFISPA